MLNNLYERQLMNRHNYRLETLIVLFVFFATMLTAQAQSRGPNESTLPVSIQQFRDAFVATVRDRDVNSWAELLAESGVMMTPSGQTTEGRAAFREYWNRAFQGATGPNPLEVTIQDARIGADLAVVRADYGPAGREPVGQYVWVLERENSEPWMLVWWMYNRRSSVD